MKHDIAILMATYQSSKYIVEQIRSIQQQTYKEWQLIISDDGSKDDTREIITSLVKQDSRIILLPEPGPQCGVVANFSRLMSETKAPYILFSDHDDVWLPQKIEKSMEKMLEMEQLFGEKTPLLVHTDLTVVDAKLQLIHPSFWRYVHLDCHRDVELSRILVQNVVTGCTMLINRSLAVLADPIPKEALMHDWWLALTATALGKIGIVDESVIQYRQHGNNHTGAQKYGFFSGFKKYWRTRTQRGLLNKKKAEQAQVFFDRYQDRLSKEQKEVFLAYQKLCLGSYAERRYFMLKHGFLKHGFLRKAHDLLLE